MNWSGCATELSFSSLKEKEVTIISSLATFSVALGIHVLDETRCNQSDK